MAQLIKHLNEFMEKGKESPIDHYFLMGSPIKVLGVLALYLFFIKWVGPKFMENRKPFQIDNLLITYNIVQIILNALLSIIGTYLLFSYSADPRCMTLQPKGSHEALLEARMMYFYFIIKVIDLLDTVFFTIRKKYNQATFLHIYHHFIVVFFSYFYTRFLPGGHAAVLGVVNSFVHVIMYTYYFLTVLKPELKASIWWKKHITHLQIAQFIFLIIHFAYPMFSTSCKYPFIASFVPFSQNVIMIILFANFYYHTYIRQTKKKFM